MTADPHATAVPRTEVSASLSELRTFLIADIRGYTRFTQQHGDEIAARLAARFAALMREGVVARGGHVLELRGDEALAVFGSARAALRAALAVQASLAEATAANPVLPLAVGMGLDAGEAVPVEGGYRGGALNLAARLCSLAGPGEVFASEGVVHLAGTVAGLAYVERGQVPLKGLAAPVRVVQVVPEGAEPAELRPLPGAAGRLRPLPVPPTPFIGRVSEVAAVSALLRGGQQRLVTLTGAGGTGKTRLALEVARQVQDACADGVAFVSLAPLSDPALVVSAIAQALGVREAAGQPLVETLTESLRSKQLLLVLDNFEHLLAAATLVAELLAACPGLTVLATSRAPLRVQGEQEYLVPPLVVPDPQHLPPLAVLTQYEAVRLFSMRAQQVKADFAVSPQNAAAVAQICARLDGLPLAIELAAARVRLLPPPALLARLGSRLGLLVGGPWDLPARQQTLRATLDWSYSLLSEDEQRLFARLAVFVGGRTLEAIEAVCNSAGDLDVLEGVQSLVEKNLMRQEEGVGGEPRVVLLETIHEYAWERLAASGEAEELRRRHAAFFVTLAEVAEPELTGPHQGEWLQRLEAEHANLRAALTWSSEQGGWEVGLRLGGALWWFWYVHGHLSEGRRWLEGLLRQAPAGGGAGALAAARAKALNGAGVLAVNQGDYGRATALFEESLALRRELGDKRGIARSLNNLGQVARNQGDHGRARVLYEESLALTRELGDKWGIALPLHNLGIVAREQGDYGRAAALQEEALALHRELGDKGGIALSLISLGNVASEQGDYGRATALYEESLALTRELGDKQGIATALNNLGNVAYEQADYRRATALLEEALALCREIGDKWLAPYCLEGLAGVTSAQGQPERAARLCGAAAALREAIGAPLPPAERTAFDRTVAAARAALGEDAFAVAWAAGQALSLEQAIAEALTEPVVQPWSSA